MNYLKTVLLSLFTGIALSLHGQTEKRAMEWEDMLAWERVTDTQISDDGQWIICKTEPWQGNATATLYNQKGEEIRKFPSVDNFRFSASSGYLFITVKPTVEETEKLKLEKVKKEEMPMNRLLLYPLGGKEETIDSIRNYKPAEKADWIAYQQGRKDSTLYIRDLRGGKTVSFPFVSSYDFAKEKNMLYYQTQKEEKTALYIYLPEKGESSLIYEGSGSLLQTIFNKEGTKLAFLYSPEKDSASVHFSLFLSENGQAAYPVETNPVINSSSGNRISPYQALRFSGHSDYLLFGIAPLPKQKDMTIPDENRPVVQIWNWNEEVQYTQQTVNKKKELQKSYVTLYDLKNRKILPLATTKMPIVEFTKEIDTPFALGKVTQPYGTERMWRGKERADIYLLDLNTGEKELIRKGLIGKTELSPAGQYVYWYNPEDSCWYTYSNRQKKEIRLTTPDRFIMWNEEQDVPDFPNPHGIAGWTKDDKEVLIYDRYDIWKFDPEGKIPPVNLTKNGREENRSYRRVQTDKEEKYIDLSQDQLLTGFDEATKGYGYYQARFTTPTPPETLISGNYRLRTPVKAKNADVLVYSTETFGKYPDLLVTNRKFSKSTRLTQGYKQQDNLNWGTAELITWLSLDGIPLEGVIYKPENFDPEKIYPLLVNFYERNAETLYDYRMPEPHRSTIDYHFYTSNGYIVFNPDIRYKEGYPGESCFNAVMPGIAALVSRGYINEKAIGAQGHSWGGYQVAYLATRTHLFAAIESGAPVVNMFSAYGGIRWETGLNRSFQYEHGQSRIGATIWEKPYRYEENSPLFTMDKVRTPILIMHNDADGHVPWYQGIEYFIALKRLQKPVWMLNYPGEPHWPTKLANKVDFQKRMFQFFEHYLNNKPMPLWMEQGIPAVEQDFELGY